MVIAETVTSAIHFWEITIKAGLPLNLPLTGCSNSYSSNFLFIVWHKLPSLARTALCTRRARLAPVIRNKPRKSLLMSGYIDVCLNLTIIAFYTFLVESQIGYLILIEGVGNINQAMQIFRLIIQLD